MKRDEIRRGAGRMLGGKPLTSTVMVGTAGFWTNDLSVPNATAMVVEGVDVKTARARLGHSAPRLPLAIYAQATPKAAAKFGARLMSDQRKYISSDLEGQ